MRKNDPITKYFDNRISGILNKAFVFKVGDFANFSFEILMATGGAGDKTIAAVEEFLKENQIETLDTKIAVLENKKKLVLNYIYKKRDLENKKCQIERLQDLVKQYDEDRKLVLEAEAALKNLV